MKGLDRNSVISITGHRDWVRVLREEQLQGSVRGWVGAKPGLGIPGAMNPWCINRLRQTLIAILLYADVPHAGKTSENAYVCVYNYL